MVRKISFSRLDLPGPRSKICWIPIVKISNRSVNRRSILQLKFEIPKIAKPRSQISRITVPGSLRDEVVQLSWGKVGKSTSRQLGCSWRIRSVGFRRRAGKLVGAASVDLAHRLNPLNSSFSFPSEMPSFNDHPAFSTSSRDVAQRAAGSPVTSPPRKRDREISR